MQFKKISTKHLEKLLVADKSMIRYLKNKKETPLFLKLELKELKLDPGLNLEINLTKCERLGVFNRKNRN